MSNQIYPILIGETWPVSKKPSFSTIIQSSTGGNEVRIANYPFTFTQYNLAYDVLDMSASDFQTLYGFYCSRNGSFDSFLFWDAADNVVTAQPIGTGNGTQVAFQLQRTIGGYTQPIYDINGIIASGTGAAAPPVIKVYLNGSLQGSGYTVGNTGILTFNSAPSGGVAITATFGYFFRCRFLDDQVDFQNFVQNLFELKSMQFKVVRS